MKEYKYVLKSEHLKVMSCFSIELSEPKVAEEHAEEEFDYKIVGGKNEGLIEITTENISGKQQPFSEPSLCIVDLTQIQLLCHTSEKMSISSVYCHPPDSYIPKYPDAGLLYPTVSGSLSFGSVEQVHLQHVIIDNLLLSCLSRATLTHLHIDGFLRDESPTLILASSIRYLSLNCCFLKPAINNDFQVVLPQGAIIKKASFLSCYLNKCARMSTSTQVYRIVALPLKSGSVLNRTTIETLIFDFSPNELQEMEVSPDHRFFHFLKDVHVSNIAIRGKFNFIEGSALYKKYIRPDEDESINDSTPAFEEQIEFLNLTRHRSVAHILREQYSTEKMFRKRKEKIEGDPFAHVEFDLIAALSKCNATALYLDTAAATMIWLTANAFLIPSTGGTFTHSSIVNVFVQCSFGYPPVYPRFEKSEVAASKKQPLPANRIFFKNEEWRNIFLKDGPLVVPKKKIKPNHYVFYAGNRDMIEHKKLPVLEVLENIFSDDIQSYQLYAFAKPLVGGYFMKARFVPFCGNDRKLICAAGEKLEDQSFSILSWVPIVNWYFN